MVFSDPNPLASIAYASCLPHGVEPPFESSALTSRAAYERLNRAAARAETLVLYRLDMLAACRDSLDVDQTRLEASVQNLWRLTAVRKTLLSIEAALNAPTQTTPPPTPSLQDLTKQCEAILKSITEAESLSPTTPFSPAPTSPAPSESVSVGVGPCASVPSPSSSTSSIPSIGSIQSISPSVTPSPCPQVPQSSSVPLSPSPQVPLSASVVPAHPMADLSRPSAGSSLPPASAGGSSAPTPSAQPASAGLSGPASAFASSAQLSIRAVPACPRISLSSVSRTLARINSDADMANYTARTSTAADYDFNVTAEEFLRPSLSPKPAPASVTANDDPELLDDPEFSPSLKFQLITRMPFPASSSANFKSQFSNFNSSSPPPRPPG